MKATAFLAENPQPIHESYEDSDDRDHCHNLDDNVAKAQKPPEARDVSALVNDPRFHNYFADGLSSVEQEIPIQYQEDAETDDGGAHILPKRLCGADFQ